MSSSSGQAEARAIRSGEDALIQRWFAPIAGSAGLGLKDDAACLSPPPGHDLVVTTDALVAGVHFFPDDPPDAIARKALRVNLSDLAAKGAAPLGFLLTLTLPAGADERLLEGISRGLGEDARAFGCPLIGGDTVSTPGPLMLSITVLGTVPAGTMVRRDNAAEGDVLFVTGTIGDAALGLALRLGTPGLPSLTGARRRHLLRRYLLPEPRVAAAESIRLCATAAMDISDGLAGDLAKLCAVSGVGATVDIPSIPFSPAGRACAADPAILARMLNGGDDYEILGTCRPGIWHELSGRCLAVGVAIHRIGIVQNERDAVVFRRSDSSIADIPLRGYSHPA